MPETSRLYLHSPAGSDVAVYKWPLHVSESWNEPHEIVETIRWVCNDFPELKLAVENYVLNNFDPTNFESMKLLCEKYNRAVDNIRKLWSGRQPPPCIDAPPSVQLLKHILNQVYNRAIARPEELNTYQAFSPEVYGETSFELITEMISATHLSENDVFLDLGSGVGQVVLQVAASAGCRSYGIEKAEIPAKYAEEMNRQFVKWMDFYGKSYGDYELLKGDFLDSQFDEIFQSATVIFCNNFAFGPSLNHKLKLKFQNLRDGVKLVSSREFCPLNFRVTERNLSDIGAMMRVAELSPLKGSVSWTSKPVSYYLHRIDRSKMEEFFHKQKHSDEKSEGSMSLSSGSSSSSESLSEDSSLDSSDDEDLFKRPYEEMHHFPPAPNKGVSSGSGSGYFHPHHSKKTVPSSITSSAIQKKATPPSGSTHLPRPHPQSVLNERSHTNSYSHGVSGNNLVTSANGNRQPRKKQSQNQGNTFKGRRTKSSLDFTPLFDRFREQMMSYINNMENPQFMSWVTDSMEKEKMKKKHLQGVIEHLESEVTTLSVETINNMKDSMSHLGITNLTPEGLLLGAKDIVMLNRQLRREVQMLEKDVYKLKEENGFITCLCKQTDETLPNDSNSTIKKPLNAVPTIPLNSQTPLEDMVTDDSSTPTATQVPPMTEATSSSDCFISNISMASSENVGVANSFASTLIESRGRNGILNPPSMSVEFLSNSLPQVTDPPASSHTIQESLTTGVPLPTTSIATTVCSSVGVSPATPSTNDVKPMSCTCITIDEPYLGSVELKEYDKFQISLETIDQAVLELGPFAKDAVTEQRPDLPPLNWQHPVLEGHSKKDKRKPYSPPTGRMIRKGRASGDCMSPLSSVGSPIGVESIVKHPAPQRRPNKKKPSQQLLDHESSPLLVGANSDGSTITQNDTSVKPLLMASDMNKPSTVAATSSQENFAIEAMLALSTSTTARRPSNEDTEDSSVSLPVTTGTPISTGHVHVTAQDVPISIAPPKVHYPSLPPLSKIMESAGNSNSSRKRGLPHHGSNSSIRSMDDTTRNTFSPLPSSLHIPPLKSPEEAVKTAKHGDDKKDVNPFWAASTPKSSDPGPSVSGLPYQLMLSPWNAMGGSGLQPTTYVPPSYPPLSRAELSGSSGDSSIPNSFRSSMLPPSYYYYNHTYPFGLTTPLANHLLTSSASQSPSVSSPLPTAHPSLSFNPYMTPPSLHPLNEAAKPKDIQNAAPWMVLGGTQFPQNNFLNTNQFATGLGVAAAPQLSLFPSLQATGGMTNLLGAGITTNTPDQSDNSKKRAPDHPPMETTSLLYPTALTRNVTGTSVQGYGPLDENLLRKQVHPSFGNVSSLVPSPSPSHDLLLQPSATSNKREKVDRKKKLKIHQINQEDFSNKNNAEKTGYDRRNTKRFTEWEIPPPTQFSSMSANINTATMVSSQVSNNKASNVSKTDQTLPINAPVPVAASLPKVIIPGVVGVSGVPLISDTRLPTLVTMSSVEDSDPIIKVDDEEDEDDVSSEGTVSVAGSPPPQPSSIQPVPTQPSSIQLVTNSNGNIDYDGSKCEHEKEGDEVEGAESQVLITVDQPTNTQVQQPLQNHDTIPYEHKVLGNVPADTTTTTNEDDEGTQTALPESPQELVISQPMGLSPDTQEEDKSAHIDYEDETPNRPPTPITRESVKEAVSYDNQYDNKATPILNEDADEDYIDIGNSSIDYNEFSPEDVAEESVVAGNQLNLISTDNAKEFPQSVKSPLSQSLMNDGDSLNDTRTSVTPSSLNNHVTLATPSSSFDKGGGMGLMEFRDKHKRSPKPKHRDHHVDRYLSKPHPPSDEEKYLSHKHNKSSSRHEGRRSLTPVHHQRSVSPVPTKDGGKDGQQYNPHKKRLSRSPDRHHVTSKKRERLGNHTHHHRHHHHRSHSQTSSSDTIHGYEGGMGYDGGGGQGEHPSWVIGGTGHSLISGSSSSSSSINEQHDLVGGAQHVSRKRHDGHHHVGKDGETSPTKRHKIKRPKGMSSHHHHHRHTQY